MKNILPNDLFGKNFNLTEEEAVKITTELLNAFKEISKDCVRNWENQKEVYFKCLKERYVDQFTFRKIGEHMERTPERIRQRVAKGLVILRKQKTAKEIYKKYLEEK